MGYDARGEIQVHANEAALLQLAVLATGSDAPALGQGDDLVRRIADAADLEGWMVTPAGSALNVEGFDTTYFFGFDRRWRPDDIATFEFLVRAGLKVSAEFTGEDGERWCWETSDGVLYEHGLVSVASHELDTLQRTQSAFAQLRAAAADGDVSDVRLRELVSELAASLPS